MIFVCLMNNFWYSHLYNVLFINYILYIIFKRIIGVLNFQRCKENNEWDKEGSQDTLKKGIREVSRKGFQCLMKEKQENQEEYKDIESEFTQKCLSIHRNILPGVPQDTTINKVIEKISQNSGINE